MFIFNIYSQGKYLSWGTLFTTLAYIPYCFGATPKSCNKYSLVLTWGSSPKLLFYY